MWAVGRTAVGDAILPYSGSKVRTTSRTCLWSAQRSSFASSWVDPVRRQLAPALAEQWIEKSAVDRMLAEHCADDGLLPGNHKLAVVVGPLRDGRVATL
jgi:hypothetical protein